MAIIHIARVAIKTVVILGAAYAGRQCAQVLASTIPPDWRLVVIDRNTHFDRESSAFTFSGKWTDDPRLIRISEIYSHPISRQQGIRILYPRP